MIDLNDIKTYFHFSKDSKLEIDLQILPSSLLKENKPHLFTPHRTNFYHVFLLEECYPVHRVDFQSIALQPYSLLFVGKGQVHQFDALEKYQGYELIFTEEFFNITDFDMQFIRNSLLFNDFFNRNVLQLDRSAYQKFQLLVDGLQMEINQSDVFNKHYILKNLVQNLLLIAQREKMTKHPLPTTFVPGYVSVVMMFTDLLEHQFKNNKSVVKYAPQLSITEKKLGQATKQVLGKLPKDMIDARVLLEAKRFLTHSQLTVKEIGFELGFDEATNFIKYFKKSTGQTPIEFKSLYVTHDLIP